MTLSAVAGFFAPWIVYAVVIALQLVLPARRVQGYVRDSYGKPLNYRLNGLWVFVVVATIYVVLGRCNLIAWDFLWTHRLASVIGACTLGLIFTAAIVLSAKPSSGNSLLKDLFLGRRFNPQLRGGLLDAKMSLYLLGAVMLALNVISATAHHAMNFSCTDTHGIFVYAAMFLFFVSEYLFFEQVHLYTYDFFAENVGFKLGWGCITFYPYFYCIGLWSAANKPGDTATWLQVLAVVVFLSGWMLSRGANLQKFFFKLDPRKAAFGLLTPGVVSDGTHTLLCSGFWRVSRHINYLGEILMATGLTLALGRLTDPLPWLYPLYYVALLFPRQADDDRRCAQKYGPLWVEYCKRVPYRIIPGVY